MRLSSILLTGILLTSLIRWETNFENAKKIADKEHKLILLNFSGSDWCGPCIRLHKEIFESSVFKSFSDNNLVLVNADFPRLKKNQLPKEQQKINDKLADEYNSKGIFPFTVLLDAQAKVIRSWEGYPDLTPEQFTALLKVDMDAIK